MRGRGHIYKDIGISKLDTKKFAAENEKYQNLYGEFIKQQDMSVLVRSIISELMSSYQRYIKLNRENMDAVQGYMEMYKDSKISIPPYLLNKKLSVGKW